MVNLSPLASVDQVVRPRMELCPQENEGRGKRHLSLPRQRLQMEAQHHRQTSRVNFPNLPSRRKLSRRSPKEREENTKSENVRARMVILFNRLRVVESMSLAKPRSHQ